LLLEGGSNGFQAHERSPAVLPDLLGAAPAGAFCGAWRTSRGLISRGSGWGCWALLFLVGAGLRGRPRVVGRRRRVGLVELGAARAHGHHVAAHDQLGALVLHVDGLAAV